MVQSLRKREVTKWVPMMHILINIAVEIYEKFSKKVFHASFIMSIDFKDIVKVEDGIYHRNRILYRKREKICSCLNIVSVTNTELGFHLPNTENIPQYKYIGNILLMPMCRWQI